MKPARSAKFAGLALGLLPWAAVAWPQNSAPPGQYAADPIGTMVGGVVVDVQGAPVAGAAVKTSAGVVLARTASGGEFSVAAPLHSVPIKVEAEGFATSVVTVGPTTPRPLRIVLKVASASETVEVTAYRAPLAAEDSPASTRILDRRSLAEAASPALDNKLRLVPGVELFRRSSSLVANPTSQGLSLRGLGSTAASRTLVVSDDVPLNDPYGGWIHWTEPPELSIRSIEVVRGGASDLYGSSAIGGVVNLLTERPTRNGVSLLSSYGGQNTADESLLASTVHGLHSADGGAGTWGALLAAGVLRTDGYTLIAPDVRGPVDVPSSMHSQNASAETERTMFHSGRVFLRGSAFNEARGNGTPLQSNATRLWRYSAGVDLPTPAVAGGPGGDMAGTLAVRFFGSEEHYRQSFSSVLGGPNRSSENQTRLEHTPAQELGGMAHWSQPLGTALLIVAGADTRDVRATDTEQSIQQGAPAGLLDTTARQRQTGAYAEALWTPAHWTLSGGGRVDRFSNFDARQFNTAAPGPPVGLPRLTETVFDPRLGLAHHLLPRVAPRLVWSASAFRAYRAPTQNELYRTGQVGQQVTLPNSSLQSERATGWETGLEATAYNTTVRASYFWTQVNRPITALPLSPNLLQRENLGQIESRGVSFDFESRPAAWLALTGGYQFADATVTKFAPQPALVANWIPQVARNAATLQARFSRANLGTLSLQGRMSGRQFDDAANQYLLHSYFRLDAYASRNFGRHLEFFASGENLFDRAIEVGRTPTLTLGTPAVARAGLRLRWGD